MQGQRLVGGADTRRLKRGEEPAGNLDTGLLKIIALCCMVIDHMGARLFPSVTELRVIGRVAFPLYIWCMVVGACYTRSPLRYALRLLAVGLIAQPFYMLGLNHPWANQSVFTTLLVGYLGICAIRYNRWGSRFWGPVLALLAACCLNMDYGWRGVLLIMLLYLSRRSAGGILATMVAFCLFWGTNSSSVHSLFGVAVRDWPVLDTAMGESFLRLQTLALLSLPLILWPRKKRTPFPKWAAYAAYPGHLALLWIAQLLLGRMTWATSLKLLIPWIP